MKDDLSLRIVLQKVIRLKLKHSRTPFCLLFLYVCKGFAIFVACTPSRSTLPWLQFLSLRSNKRYLQGVYLTFKINDNAQSHYLDFLMQNCDTVYWRLNCKWVISCPVFCGWTWQHSLLFSTYMHDTSEQENRERELSSNYSLQSQYTRVDYKYLLSRYALQG